MAAIGEFAPFAVRLAGGKFRAKLPVGVRTLQVDDGVRIDDAVSNPRS
jgi:hypothetical protein